MTKLNRRQAIKMWNNQIPFIAVPSGFSPRSFAAITVNSEDCEASDFEKWENAFSYYHGAKRIYYYTAD